MVCNENPHGRNARSERIAIDQRDLCLARFYRLGGVNRKRDRSAHRPYEVTGPGHRQARFLLPQAYLIESAFGKLLSRNRAAKTLKSTAICRVICSMSQVYTSGTGIS